MEWTDDAVVLSARAHGEAAAVALLLTRDHGKHAGLVPGARSAARRGLLEPAHLVTARWRARLPEHLGTYTLEPVHSYGAAFLDDPVRLAGLAAACAVAEAALPERAPHRPVFEGLCALFAAFDGPAWDAAYVRWELGLLGELGYGLDLGQCAATGRNDQLAYVSPRTGRAVSLSAGAPYRDRLLPLPGFLVGRGGGTPAEVLAGLALTGHFLERHALAAHHRSLPPARQRFIERYRKAAAAATASAPPCLPSDPT